MTSFGTVQQCRFDRPCYYGKAIDWSLKTIEGPVRGHSLVVLFQLKPAGFRARGEKTAFDDSYQRRCEAVGSEQMAEDTLLTERYDLLFRCIHTNSKLEEERTIRSLSRPSYGGRLKTPFWLQQETDGVPRDYQWSYCSRCN
jgi:hypothetical protein